jgi:hypothetical protein
VIRGTRPKNLLLLAASPAELGDFGDFGDFGDENQELKTKKPEIVNYKSLFKLATTTKKNFKKIN